MDCLIEVLPLHLFYFGLEVCVADVEVGVVEHVYGPLADGLEGEFFFGEGFVFDFDSGVDGRFFVDGGSESLDCLCAGFERLGFGFDAVYCYGCFYRVTHVEDRCHDGLVEFVALFDEIGICEDIHDLGYFFDWC